MTRRFWILLFVGSLPACNQHNVRTSPPPPPPPMIGQDTPTNLVAPNMYPAANRSPYQSMATTSPRLTELPKSPEIEPVRHTLTSAQPDGPAPGESEPKSDSARSTLVSQSLPKPDAIDAKPVTPVTLLVKSEDPPLLAALRCMLDKHPEEAVTRLKGYDKANQDLMLGLLALMACLSEKSLDKCDPHETARLVDQLHGLLVPLPAWVPLVIDQMCFCRRIEKYGVYEPLAEEHEFRQGELVQIYVELRNFSTERRDRFFLTHLASSLEIHDYKGHVVWREDRPESIKRPDLSRSLRHDLFMNCMFCVPQIPQGSYTLWLQVADVGLKKQRSVRRSLDFRVTNMPVR